MVRNGSRDWLGRPCFMCGAGSELGGLGLSVGVVTPNVSPNPIVGIERVEHRHGAVGRLMGIYVTGIEQTGGVFTGKYRRPSGNRLRPCKLIPKDNGIGRYEVGVQKWRMACCRVQHN